jgi:hypothetical protein
MDWARLGMSKQNANVPITILVTSADGKSITYENNEGLNL